MYERRYRPSIDGVRERILFTGSAFTLGEFACGAESSRWHEVNEMEDAPHIAFARRNVVIRHLGREPVLANANHAVFYNPGDRYVRRLYDAGGDHCWFVRLEPGADDGGTFAFTHGPVAADAHLRLRVLARHLLEEPPDPLLVEEGLAAVVESARSAAERRSRVRPQRARTHARQRAVVEHAKAIVSSDPSARVGLGALAAAVHASQFHLARTFREQTGFTLVEYRNQLRLRLAVERLTAGPESLVRLALELGFSSHSHFTDTFRRTFGFPPSRLPRSTGRALLRELAAPAA